MFFKRKPNPEDVTEKLFACIQQAAPQGGAYRRAVCLSDAEDRRFLYSLLLFPVAASYGFTAALHPDSTAARLFNQAHVGYLSSLRNQDEVVRLGDFIVWRLERDAVIEAFQERFGQMLIPATFNAHQVRHGLLTTVLADIRKCTFVADLSYSTSMAPPDSPELGVQLLFASVATSFTRHVLAIDPSDPGNSIQTNERFQASLGFGGVMLGQIYFSILDLIKSIGA